MINTHFKYLALLAALTLGIGIRAQAQVSAGAVLGTVSDPTGALIPGVTVTVINEGTNQSRQGITNESGSYRVEPLQSGFYTVSAELSGLVTTVADSATFGTTGTALDNRQIRFGLKFNY